MAEEFSISVGECDESHCDSCGLCDKGKLFEGTTNNNIINNAADNLVLIDLGIKKICAFLIDTANGQNLGSITSLNSPEGEIVSKVEDIVRRVAKEKDPGMVVVTGNWQQCNRLNSVTTIAGARLIRIPCINKKISNNMLCAIVIAQKEDNNGSRMLINIAGNGELAILHDGKVWATSTDCDDIFDDKSKWMLLLQKAYDGAGVTANDGLLFNIGKEALKNTADELIKQSLAGYNSIVRATIINGPALAMNQNVLFIEDTLSELKDKVDYLIYNPSALRACDYFNNPEVTFSKDVEFVNSITIIN